MADFDRIVSYSELDSYRQCPLKHELEYNQRWTKPPREDGALAIGSAWHLILEDHYKAMMLAQDGKQTAQMRQMRAEVAGHKRLRQMRNDVNYDLLSWMYDGYIEQWKDEAAIWWIKGVERKFVAPLPYHPDVGLPGFEAIGLIGIKVRLDLLVEDVETGGIWVVDHKSGGNLPTSMDLEIDDQFGLYTAILKDKGIDVMGAIHNAARTTMNQGDYLDFEKQTERMIELRDSMEKGPERTELSRKIGGRRNSKPQALEQRFSRTYLNRTDNELESIKRDAAAVAAVMAWPGLPLYSSPDPRSCGWKCSFKEAHLTMREGRQVNEVMQEYGFKQNFERH